MAGWLGSWWTQWLVRSVASGPNGWFGQLLVDPATSRLIGWLTLYSLNFGPVNVALIHPGRLWFILIWFPPLWFCRLTGLLVDFDFVKFRLIPSELAFDWVRVWFSRLFRSPESELLVLLLASSSGWTRISLKLCPFGDQRNRPATGCESSPTTTSNGSRKLPKRR